MTPFRCALMSGRGRASPALVQATPLSLDFAAGAYGVGANVYGSIGAVPGYAFSRSGEQGAMRADGTVDWFAANVPAITDRGYHAYAALTNSVAQSQNFAVAPWIPWAGATVDSNVAAAPDGTTTADRLSFAASAGSQLYFDGGVANATLSLWARCESGTRTFRLYASDGSVTSPEFTATTSWQRFVHGYAGLPPYTGILNGSAGSAGSILVWQAQALAGSFADGGPMIRTSGAPASIGASALSLAAAPGEYLATFTFDDQSNQALPMAVGGLFHHPTAGTLSRGIVRKTLAAAA